MCSSVSIPSSVSFYVRDAMHKFVRLSVRLSDTFVYSVETNSSWSSMLVVINKDLLTRGALCGKLHGGRSQLFEFHQSSIDSQLLNSRIAIFAYPTCIRRPR